MILIYKWSFWECSLLFLLYRSDPVIIIIVLNQNKGDFLKIVAILIAGLQIIYLLDLTNGFWKKKNCVQNFRSRKEFDSSWQNLRAGSGSELFKFWSATLGDTLFAIFFCLLCSNEIINVGLSSSFFCSTVYAH